MEDPDSTPRPEATNTHSIQPTDEATENMKDLRESACDCTPRTTDHRADGIRSTPDDRADSSVARRFLIIMLLVAVTATGAMAQMVSVTVSPLQASKKIAQLTGELKIIDVISLSGVAGIGSHEDQLVAVGGGQVRVYLSGGFNGGMHIGAEALYTEMGKASDITGIINVMNGVSGGPFVGFKHVFDFGLTLDVAGGIRFKDGRIETGDSTAEPTALGPLANVNIGWSF